MFSMTTDSGQAQYASNPPQEPVDEMQSSGQQGSQTVPVGSGQALTPANSSDDNMAGGARSVAASPQDQGQGPHEAPAGYGQDTTAGAPGYQQDTTAGAPGYQQDTAGGVDSAFGTAQQTRAAAQTSQQGPALRSEDAKGFGTNSGAGFDGAQHSLITEPSGYARRWESIQVGFVDDPRSAVQEAETLVSDVMREMTAIFQRQRQQLEEQWSGGNQASTDDLRVAFQRYRDFFQRLLQM